VSPAQPAEFYNGSLMHHTHNHHYHQSLVQELQWFFIMRLESYARVDNVTSPTSGVLQWQSHAPYPQSPLSPVVGSVVLHHAANDVFFTPDLPLTHTVIIAAVKTHSLTHVSPSSFDGRLMEQKNHSNLD